MLLCDQRTPGRLETEVYCKIDVAEDEGRSKMHLPVLGDALALCIPPFPVPLLLIGDQSLPGVTYPRLTGVTRTLFVGQNDIISKPVSSQTRDGS